MATISMPGLSKYFEAENGQNLLEALRKEGVPVPAVCGGRGTCGKCLIKVDGGPPVLACKINVDRDISVEVVRDEKQFAILEDFFAEEVPEGGEEGVALAVDIGTTTVVLQAIDLMTGKAVGGRSFVNGQRKWGADVITRIKMADEGGLETLRSAIASELAAAIRELATECAAPIRRVCVAGNTTMIYLLLGLPCRSLGQYPFTPEFVPKPSYQYSDVFGDGFLDCEVWIVPFISAFVGGDITAGILVCGAKNPDGRPWLLVDMGTNGEMALSVGGKLLCTSTAAGPAFEGGGISCGMGGVRGAISAVACQDGKFVCETIGSAPPIGICGSGVLDAGACLVEGGFVDETGCLDDDWFDDGVTLATAADGTAIVFTQRDVRELQLAKSAIRAGIGILMREAGVSVDEIGAVYLAGGFGQKLRVESAVAIGLLPRELGPKVTPCGNSALGGCIRYMLRPDARELAREIATSATELNLSSHPDFNNDFMMHMGFEE